MLSRACLLLLAAPIAALHSLVPAYIHPTIAYGRCIDKNWISLAKGGDAVYAIINPDNGPAAHGTQYYHEYLPCLLYLHSKQVKMLGYVGTKLDANRWRAPDTVKAEIHTWAVAYPYISGIFLDMKPDHSASFGDTAADLQQSSAIIDYYTDLFEYFKKNWWSGYKIAINPGSPFPEEFVHRSTFEKTTTSTADIVVTFQGDFADFNPTCSAPWCEKLLSPSEEGYDHLSQEIAQGKYPYKNFAAMVYKTPASEWRNTMIKAANGNLNTVFVSDEEDYHPESGQYGNQTKLPSYWEPFLTTLDRSCGGTKCIWSGHHVRVIHNRRFTGRFVCNHHRGACHCKCIRTLHKTTELKDDNLGAAFMHSRRLSAAV